MDQRHPRQGVMAKWLRYLEDLNPESKDAVKTDADDETVRRYSQYKLLLALGSVGGLWGRFLTELGYLLMKRDNVVKFS